MLQDRASTFESPLLYLNFESVSEDIRTGVTLKLTILKGVRDHFYRGRSIDLRTVKSIKLDRSERDRSYEVLLNLQNKLSRVE